MQGRGRDQQQSPTAVQEKSIEVVRLPATAGGLDALVPPEISIPALPVDIGTRTLLEGVPEVQRAARGVRIAIGTVVIE
jgi:hypothetical protein